VFGEGSSFTLLEQETTLCTAATDFAQNLQEKWSMAFAIVTTYDSIFVLQEGKSVCQTIVAAT